MKTIQVPVQKYKTVIVNNMETLIEKVSTVLDLTYCPYKRQKIIRIMELVKNFTGTNNTYLFVEYVRRAYISLLNLAHGDTVERENIGELADMMAFYFLGNNVDLLEKFIDEDFYISAEIQEEEFAFKKHTNLRRIMDMIRRDERKVKQERQERKSA